MQRPARQVAGVSPPPLSCWCCMVCISVKRLIGRAVRLAWRPTVGSLTPRHSHGLMAERPRRPRRPLDSLMAIAVCVWPWLLFSQSQRRVQCSIIEGQNEWQGMGEELGEGECIRWKC